MIKFEPLGAAKQGERVCFIAHAPRVLHKEVILSIRADDDSFYLREKMEWVSLDDDGCDVYEFYLDTSDMRGLYWYSADENVYQLSVCDKNLSHPDWYGEGVTYHIFVDRFNRDGAPLENDADYYVHRDLNDIPHYLPNEINLDIYGGNLQGIIKKLDYLNSLGVKTLYLSPIFEAWSNHKYNTANYSKIDPHFGTDDDLKELCDKAKNYGMRVILDGVFNHVGSDSIYFNKNGRYDSIGAWQGENSPYRKWFNFWDNTYDSWWGILTLPAVNEHEESYMAHIAEIARKWLNLGISGWRLDVADELPDEFLRFFNSVVKDEKKNAVIIGEVWEDASNKIAYSVRRKYFTESELDGVMNYPIRDAILGYATGQKSATDAANIMNTIALHYPKEVLNSLMNHIGTHDTPRALSVLARPDIAWKSRDEQYGFKLSEDEQATGVKRLKCAAVLQYMYPGSPCIYYGDEAGSTGGADPFNRAYFPWGRENAELYEHYKVLGELKNTSECLKHGEFSAVVQEDALVLSRYTETQKIYACVSRSKCKIALETNTDLIDAFSGKVYRAHFGKTVVNMPESGCVVLKDFCR